MILVSVSGLVWYRYWWISKLSMMGQFCQMPRQNQQLLIWQLLKLFYCQGVLVLCQYNKTTKCSVPLPFLPPNWLGSRLSSMSFKIHSFRKPSNSLDVSDVHAIFLIWDNSCTSGTFCNGVTYSTFHKSGYICSLRQVLKISFKGRVKILDILFTASGEDQGGGLTWYF